MKGTTDLMRHRWATQKDKDIILGSVWEQLGNRSNPAAELPKMGEKTVPKDVFHAVAATQTSDEFSLTIPLEESLKGDGVGGMQLLRGTEEDTVARNCKTYYNNVRKAVNMANEGVEFGSTAYIQKAKDKYDLLGEWMAANRDYSAEKAIYERDARYLIDDQFWAGNANQTTAPVARAIHPNIAYLGMNAAPTRSATVGTDLSNIAAALKAMSSASVFNKAALVSAITFGRRFATPLNWKSGAQKINHIVMISEIQAIQLQNDSAWQDLWKGAGERGIDNRAISGVVGGPFMECLVIVNPRQPIFRLNSGSIGFEYVTPMLGSSFNSLLGLQNLNREAKGAATVQTGTCEVCYVLGAGALGVPNPKKLKYIEEKTDFGHFTALAASEVIGHNRLDFKAADGTYKNISSGLFFTATPAFTY